MRADKLIEHMHAGCWLIRESQRWGLRDPGGKPMYAGPIHGSTACNLIREWPGGLYHRVVEGRDEWCRKAGIVMQDDGNLSPRAGTCRICGCTDEAACYIAEKGRNCSWHDSAGTLCDHPKCLAAAVRGG